MRLTFTFFIIAFTGTAATTYGQDTLPRISVKKVSNKVIISWKNTYGANIKTINIQRSIDSTKFFTTIGTVLNPTNRDNGFVDNKSTNDKTYYRVFIAFEGGDYLFSKAYLPAKDTVVVKVNTPVIPEVVIALPQQPTGFIPSKYIYTGKENNVIINLPDAATKKYSVKFFDTNDKFLFEIKKITETYLIVEKVNFLKSGWFNFQLFDDDVLVEKYQFNIPKDTNKKSSPIIEQGKNF